jgi:hypothetical protein
MSAIIKYDHIVFIARDANNRRGPKVTMYKIELINGMRSGLMKGQTNMTP